MGIISKRNLYLSGIVLFSFFLVYLVTILIFPNLQFYHMHIYLNNQPSDSGAKEVKSCLSFNPDFSCNYNRPISGMYIKAITYRNTKKVSESNWEVVING